MKGLFSHMQKKPRLFLRNIGIYLVLQYNQECTLISKNLIPQHGLQQQDEPFTTEEIDAVIKHMPTYKVLGPDGFDGIFIKKCRDIIRKDIYNLCQEFYNGTIDIQLLNNAFITLVPKINTQTTVNDFRTISLINCVTKIITKILGSRLQQEIIPLVHLNQYGFIKTRTIQDCLAWAFEYIHQCHYSRREIVILKLDFTNAFDTIEHKTILQMMQQLGFSAKWTSWVKQILSTATTLVLLRPCLFLLLSWLFQPKS
jgi:hypothetical protein